MKEVENQQLALAFEYVNYTDKNIFLTGKAGTGKTTFLHTLKKESLKRMIVVAPTGVAAINAGGVTIHSFFQLPFGPQIPKEYLGDSWAADVPEEDVNKASIQKFNKDKINIIRSLDLLVVDEVSMVRADLLDGIDTVLRRFRDRSKPFGGVQLLMIGDLQQLAPVIKDDEWAMLSKYYNTIYFFSSLALKQTELVSIELKHIYRQSDATFIDILNKVRDNCLDQVALSALNSRYIPNFECNDGDGYITLTTHNNQAHTINEKHLQRIDATPYIYKATITGNFPEYSYPTEPNLELKVGAQVMFVKNDTSPEKLYYNGKIGAVADIDDDGIWVQCPGDENPINVTLSRWDNTKYSIDPETDAIVEEVVGSFEQYPLKLAWAITIHKSQGLTFEKAVVDAKAAFASGQVYVALSRCKTLEGLVLSSPISESNVKTDETVRFFSSRVEEYAPTLQMLEQGKREYQLHLLHDLFSFNTIAHPLNYCRKLAVEHPDAINEVLKTAVISIINNFKSEIVDIAEKFKKQLLMLAEVSIELEQNEALQDRVSKGCTYFYEKVEEILQRGVRALSVEIDNKAIKKTFTDSILRIEDEIRIKKQCLNASKSGFNVRDYLEVRAKASVDKVEVKANRKPSTPKTPTDIVNPELYLALKGWRESKADELDVPIYMVFPQKALYDLLLKLPTTMTDLRKVKGFGEKKLRQFGTEIIDIIADYCEDSGLTYSKSYVIEYNEKEESKPKATGKVDTKKLSFDLLLEGNSIEQIAQERGLVASTVESHLLHFIATGELDIHRVLESGKIAKIESYFENNAGQSLSDAKNSLGEEISFGEIRMVRAYLNAIEENI